MAKKIDTPKQFFLLIVFTMGAALIFVDIGWAEYSILQAKSIDEFAFHKSLLNIYDGITRMDMRATFSFGFFSYGFTWFLLNVVASLPFLSEAGNPYAIIIPRLLNSAFFIMSTLVVTKLINTSQIKYNFSSIFVILFILSMPGMWLNAVWFHPDFAMSFFILCALYFLVEAKIQFNRYYWLGILMFGLGISIKLQAITFGAVIALFFIKNTFETKNWRTTLRAAIYTFLLLMLIFVLNNPYILHPTGFNAWLFDLEQNIISNSTNHGVGDTTYLARLDGGVFNNFLPAITYGVLFTLSALYTIKDFHKKEACVLAYAGVYILSNFIYLLFFVNKTWGHYYIPLMLLSPLLLLAFVDSVSTNFSSVRKARFWILAIIVSSQLYTYGGKHFEFYQLRIQNMAVSRDSGLIVNRDYELAKADEIFNFLIKENLGDKLLLASPYINFPLNRLKFDYRSYHTIYGPLSTTLKQRSYKGRKNFDLILISKNDIYFNDLKISSMAEADEYIKSKKLITDWLGSNSSYILKSENKNYYLFENSVGSEI